MKKIFLFLTVSAMFTSCSDDWDKHYNEESDNASPLTLKEYLSTESQYSRFYALLEASGVADELGKNQYLTVWAVGNGNYDDTPFLSISDILLGGYHANYLAFNPVDLKPNLRIKCINGIYVSISDKADGQYINSSKILSAKRFKNGVVYEISELMRPRTNLFDYISMLGDDYSIIRDSIVSYNTQVFDPDNSIPIGVNQTGNTVYDSVFYTANPLFKTAPVNSEFQQFTMFLPSNAVISECLTTLKSQYDMMGNDFTLADSLLAMSWIKDAVFMDGIVYDYHAAVDLKSLGGKTWRTTVQQIQEEAPEDLSNGRVYQVTKLKIPNNVIVSRIKSLVHYYEYLTEEEQKAYFSWQGKSGLNNPLDVSIVKGDETPIAGIFYWLFKITGDAATTDDVYAEFFPIKYEEGEPALVQKVPPGEYNLYMGFRSRSAPYVDIYFQSGDQPIPANATPVATELSIFNSTPWNYDRVTETDPSISKWNGLGGLVGVVNVTGNEMSTFKLKVKVNRAGSVGGARAIEIYHWALKPTANNY